MADNSNRPRKSPNRRTGSERSRPADGGRHRSGGTGQRRTTGRPRNERPVPPPGLAARENEPQIPPDLDLDAMPRGMKAELRGLPKDLADKVAPHLLMAGRLVEEDPRLAFEHALVARRLASRLPVVREAVAETAYAAEEFATALSEYRAIRRMSGRDDYLPIMADCERALGRPEDALELAREAATRQLEPAHAVEMRIVEAGARADLGQRAEALRLLRGEIEASRDRAVTDDTARARLRYAYADLLLAGGDEDGARQWFAAAAKLDQDQSTDADERLAVLDGMVINYGEDDDEGGDDE